MNLMSNKSPLGKKSLLFAKMKKMFLTGSIKIDKNSNAMKAMTKEAGKQVQEAARNFKPRKLPKRSTNSDQADAIAFAMATAMATMQKPLETQKLGKSLWNVPTETQGIADCIDNTGHEDELSLDVEYMVERREDGLLVVITNRGEGLIVYESRFANFRFANFREE